MILSIPVKAEKEFVELCQAVKNSTNEREWEIRKAKAEGYSQAMQTLLGVSVWAAIVMEADRSFD